MTEELRICPACGHADPHDRTTGSSHLGLLCQHCSCKSTFRDNALKAIEETRGPLYGPYRVPWSEWHHCKPPLGNPTREEAMEQVTYLRGIIERLRALDAGKLPCGCNARFALTIGGACTICEVERLRTKLTESEREQAITAKVIQSQQEQIRKLTAALIEAGRLVHAYICPYSGHIAGCIDIAEALADEQEERS